MSRYIDRTKVKHIKVWDLDQTLIGSPLPNVGKDIYKQKTNKDWPYVGWWSKPESLDMTIFDIPVISDVIEEYHKAYSQENTLMVLLTGRLPKLSQQVESILNHYNIIFDLYLYNSGGPTEVSKLKSLDKLLIDYPNVETVCCWDDRKSHIPHFEAWGAKNNHIQFTLHKVENGEITY